MLASVALAKFRREKMEEQETVTIDGIHYDRDSITTEGSKCIHQMQILQQEIQDTNMLLDRYQTCFNSYADTLKTELQQATISISS